MKYAKYPFLFCAGGGSYVLLELIWRGWSHGSMFLAGGASFLLLGQLSNAKIRPVWKALLGAGVITGVELATGLLFNRNYQVWDYRKVPLSFMGQICLPFSLLWISVGMGAMGLYRTTDRLLSRSKHLSHR